MEFRSLGPGDEALIGDIARRSLESSYAAIIPSDVMTTAVDQWYSADRIEAYRTDPEIAFVIAEEDSQPVGFAQCQIQEDLGQARILWLHVEPESRGSGVGRNLLEYTRTQLRERGIDSITAAVLADHRTGITFYEAHGFEQLGERTVDIGEATFQELILRADSATSAPLEARLNNGDRLYVDHEETDRGSRGAFCAVYRDADRDRRYGWFCSACHSFETAMDTMGRIQCVSCGNTRKPSRWDAAYL